MEDLIRKIANDVVQTKLSSFTNFVAPQHTHNKVDSLPVKMGDLILDNRGLIFPYSIGKISIVSDNAGIAFANYVATSSFIVGEADTASYPGSYLFNDIAFNASTSVGAVVETSIIEYSGLTGILTVGDIVIQGTNSGIIVAIPSGSTISVNTMGTFVPGAFTTSTGAMGTVVSFTGQITEFTILPDSINTQITANAATMNETVNSTGISYTASGDFSIQLPDTTRPSPQAGMIAFESGVFYACADGISWQVISLI